MGLELEPEEALSGSAVVLMYIADFYLLELIKRVWLCPWTLNDRKSWRVTVND